MWELLDSRDISSYDSQISITFNFRTDKTSTKQNNSKLYHIIHFVIVFEQKNYMNLKEKSLVSSYRVRTRNQTDFLTKIYDEFILAEKLIEQRLGMFYTTAER
jgi:hypothetical protein